MSATGKNADHSLHQRVHRKFGRVQWYPPFLYYSNYSEPGSKSYVLKLRRKDIYEK
ncbi:hypothetical protein EDD59_10567 [Muricomes intestini]|jgi:hypothetical protein|uniref:Uncharacterized protein n=1 Tax=Muricomes intestini TaxID=1796634 RepID=A0A4R3KBW5_9FIRM|nr:hypothetical protein EDD59_10567 [Muricomes intestini]